jgi:hypothetical protein
MVSESPRITGEIFNVPACCNSRVAAGEVNFAINRKLKALLSTVRFIDKLSYQ